MAENNRLPQNGGTEQGTAPQKKKKSRIDPLFFVILIGAVLIAWLEMCPPRYSEDDTLNSLIATLVTRLIGVAIFIPMAVTSHYRVYGFTKKRRLYGLLITVPALLVVINNLPILGLVTGRCTVEKTGLVFWIYAAESLSIGLFEELAFRGVLFPMVLEKRRQSTKSIFWATVGSSAVFGLVHLVNLAVSPDFGSVILQVGYSFLIGGMCAAVLLHTKCVWLCVFLHSVFDFCGYLVPKLGAEEIGFFDIWDPVTIAITAVLGLAALAHFLFVMKKTTPEDVAEIFAYQGK